MQGARKFQVSHATPFLSPLSYHSSPTIALPFCYSTRLIVIAEKKTVYEKFPTPLINRLEKHFVLTSSVLTEWQLDVLHHFQNWIHQFSSITGTMEWELCLTKYSHRDASLNIELYSNISKIISLALRQRHMTCICSYSNILLGF